MKFTRVDKSTEEDVFWMYFIHGTFLPLISIFIALSTTYSNYEKNRLKWKGIFWGHICYIPIILLLLFTIMPIVYIFILDMQWYMILLYLCCFIVGLTLFIIARLY